MGSLNQITLVGCVGQDPALVQASTAEGLPWCHLMIATNDRAADGGEHTVWHRVTCWGDQAVACCEHLRKGSWVAVTGRLMYRVFRVGSQRRWAANIEAKSVAFMDRGTGQAPPIPEGAAEVDP